MHVQVWEILSIMFNKEDLENSATPLVHAQKFK